MPYSVPNYLTTDVAGLVTANFSGGVTMPLGIPGDITALATSIRWLNSVGQALAFTAGYQTGDRTTLRLGARTSTADVQRAYVNVAAAVTGDISEIVAVAVDSANTQTATILDSKGGSDYARRIDDSGWIFHDSAVSNNYSWVHNYNINPLYLDRYFVIGYFSPTNPPAATGIYQLDMRSMKADKGAITGQGYANPAWVRLASNTFDYGIYSVLPLFTWFNPVSISWLEYLTGYYKFTLYRASSLA